MTKRRAKPMIPKAGVTNSKTRYSKGGKLNIKNDRKKSA